MTLGMHIIYQEVGFQVWYFEAGSELDGPIRRLIKHLETDVYASKYWIGRFRYLPTYLLQILPYL